LYSLPKRSLLYFIAVIDDHLAVGVAGATHRLALVQLHEETVPKTEVRVVKVTLLHIIHVYEFRELFRSYCKLIGLRGEKFKGILGIALLLLQIKDLYLKF
jgi:hypothetical protein